MPITVFPNHSRDIVLGVSGRATAIKAIGEQLLPWTIIQPDTEGLPGHFIHRLSLSLSL